MTSDYAQQFNFGAGSLWGLRTDIANATPVSFGTLQDVSLEFSGDTKMLYGQNQYAIALARGKTKVDLKAKFAQIRGALFNNIYFGGTPTATQTLVAENEAATAVAETYTVANSAHFLNDLGVTYAATGIPLTYTASASPAVQGTYTQSAGVYKLAVADATAAVLTSYTYSTVAGTQIILNNQRMGVTPVFQATFEEVFDGRQAVFTFNNCVAGKLSMPTKQDDFTINEIDFAVSANAAGVIGTINFAL